MFLDAWLRDNLDQELVADLLDGTKTDSMPTLEENQRRMLDWWATALARDSKLAKIFSHLTTKAGFKFPSVLLLPVSTAAAQLQSWLLEKTSGGWDLVRSLCSRVEHAAVALVTLLLGLCQQGKITQEAGQLVEQGAELGEQAVATSLVATSFVAPALAETTDFGFDPGNPSPPPPAVPDSRKSKVASQGIVKRGPRRARPQYEVGPALRFERTIDYEWRRLVAARKSVHSAFARLIRDAHPPQSKQKHRKQRRN
jgi:hypothetical protein